MAILNGIISKLCGSAGNLTFKRNGGQTVVSEKITQKKDAKTGQQLKQRMKWANIIREYQVLQPYMKLAFGGTRNRRSDYHKFVSSNLSHSPVYLTKPDVNAGICIVAPYEITHGKVKSISVTGKGNQAVTDIDLGDLVITAETTVAEFSNAVVQNNRGYDYGDQITYFLLTQEVNDVTHVPMVNVDASSVVLVRRSETKLLSLADVRGFSIQEGCLAAQQDHDFGNHGMVWVHSQKRKNKTEISAQYLIVENKLLEAYQNDEAYEEAVNSYGGSTDIFLSPDEKSNKEKTDEVVSPTTPTDTKKTLTLVANPRGGGSVTGGGKYEAGTEVTITATPSENYTFKRWSDNDTSASRTITVNSNQTLTAYFEKVTGGDSSEQKPGGGLEG